MTKLRPNAHKLNIENGSYSNIPRKNGICTVCSTTSVENEMHFLLECSAYIKEGEDFFMKFKQLSNIFNHRVLIFCHLYHIFNSKNVTVIKLFVTYIISIS